MSEFILSPTFAIYLEYKSIHRYIYIYACVCILCISYKIIQVLLLYVIVKIFAWDFQGLSALPILHDLPGASSPVFNSAWLFAWLSSQESHSRAPTRHCGPILQSPLQSAGLHLRLFGFFDLLWLVCLAHVVKGLQSYRQFVRGSILQLHEN